MVLVTMGIIRILIFLEADEDNLVVIVVLFRILGEEMGSFVVILGMAEDMASGTLFRIRMRNLFTNFAARLGMLYISFITDLISLFRVQLR